MTSELQDAMISLSVPVHGAMTGRLTPLMIRPKEIGNCFQAGQRLVGIG